MSQNLKKKLISIQIKMAQDKHDGESRSCAVLSPIDNSSCLLKYKGSSKELGKRALKTLINKLRMRSCASCDISPPDPCYKVVYLGNVLTGWAKGENCVEKPLSTLWRNYTQSHRADVRMQLVVSGGGLKATTRDHGLTEYWANRISYCAAPTTFPRLFCWVYRHEGKRLRHELRCHAVLCSSASVARKLAVQLKASLAQALAEFKRDKISRQNARLSLVNSCYENPSLPRRKILLSTGSQNYRPPLERSKSAPKLTIIEENIVEEEDEDVFELKKDMNSNKVPPHLRRMRHCDSTSVLLDKNFKMRPEFPKRDLAARLPPLQLKNLNETNITNNNNISQRILKPNLNQENNNLINSSEEKHKCPQNQQQLLTLINENILEDTFDTKETITLEELAIELENIEDSKSKQIIEEMLSKEVDKNINKIINNYDNNHCIKSRTWQESDEGSLSSGCESAGTTTSDLDTYQSQNENHDTILSNEFLKYINDESENSIKFKIGSSVLAKVRSLERLSACNNGIRTFQNYIPELDDVSLVPIGEISHDFSSLRIFKKKTENNDSSLSETQNVNKKSSSDLDEEDENFSSCSDESGYVELLESVQDNKVELV